MGVTVDVNGRVGPSLLTLAACVLLSACTPDAGPMPAAPPPAVGAAGFTAPPPSTSTTSARAIAGHASTISPPITAVAGKPGAGTAGTPAAGSGGAKSPAAAISGSGGSSGSAGRSNTAGSSGSPAANGGSGGAAGDDSGLDPFDPDPTPTGPRDVDGPCKDLDLFCFDIFDMFIFNPECSTCNNGMGCQACEGFQAI